MTKVFFSIFLLSIFSLNVFAQPATREELEKQRIQLKKEIEETENLLNKNKVQTKENLLQYNLISKKVNLQDKVIDNINRDLDRLNNSMYLISRDIYRYDRLLDTLKQEYAKSMIYAYKNRSSYDFLNFIFSAGNFNDAIKRISYLKSYRNYREMQGENIRRTQNLRKNKIVDLRGTKEEKNKVLDVQSIEMAKLEVQQREKDRILSQLKKQGKQLNKQIAAKQKQMQKVNNAITAAIKRAQKEAIEKAIIEKEKLRIEEQKNKKSTDINEGVKVKKETPTKAEIKVIPKKESILLNADNTILNNNFEKNRGSLPWPLDRGLVLMHYGKNTLPSGTIMDVTSVTISSDIGSTVKSVFDGIVTAIQQVEDMMVVIIQHGRYFTTYSNLSNVVVKKGQEIKTGQSLGKVATNFDGIGAIDFYISNETSNYDPEKWLRRR